MKFTWSSPGFARAPWLRNRWVRLAMSLLAAQVAVMWIVSPSPKVPDRLHDLRPAGIELANPRLAAEWHALLSPDLLLRPVPQGYSGSAWMNGGSISVDFPPLTVGHAPLPFVPAASVDGSLLLPREELGPVGRWRMPEILESHRTEESLPLADQTTVRIVSGLPGWKPLPPNTMPIPTNSPAARSVVCRIRITPEGEIAEPPVIWEGSGDERVDRAALSLVEQVRFELTDPIQSPEVERSGIVRTVGWIAIDWGLPEAGRGVSRREP